MVKIICGSWTEVYFTYHNILPPEAYSSVIFGGLQTRAAVTHSGCRHCPSQWGGGGAGGGWDSAFPTPAPHACPSASAAGGACVLDAARARPLAVRGLLCPASLPLLVS